MLIADSKQALIEDFKTILEALFLNKLKTEKFLKLKGESRPRS